MHFTDPLELFRAAVEAYITGDYPTVARLVDPVSLRAHKRQLLYRFESRGQTRTPTVEEMLESSPDMPRAVAEYQVAQYQELADSAAQFERELPGVTSLDALRALDADQVLVAMLEGRSVQRHVERAVAEGHLGPEALAAMAEFQRMHNSFPAIGVVEDSPRIAYVLYHTSAPEAYETTDELEIEATSLPADELQLERDIFAREMPRIAVCRRQPDGSWLLHLNHSFPFFESMQIRIDPIEASDADEEAEEES